MLDRQENTISMVNKVNIVVDKHVDVYADNKAMLESIEKEKTLIVKITDVAQRQSFDNSTFVEEKQKYRNSVTTQGIIICGILRSYAAAINDQDLYKNVDYTKSKMKNLRDTLFIILSKFLIEKSTSLLDELKDYGMTQKLIDDYGKEADGYITAVAKPQAAIAAKAEATAELKILFKKLSEIINKQLDNNMLLYMTTHPQFYTEYVFAREIFDTGSRALSIYGKVIDEETKLPLSNVKVTVKFKAGSALANTVKKTSKHGNYQFKKLQEDKCQVIFEKNYYDTLTVDSEVIKNQGTRVDVAIRKTE